MSAHVQHSVNGIFVANCTFGSGTNRSTVLFYPSHGSGVWACVGYRLKQEKFTLVDGSASEDDILGGWYEYYTKLLESMEEQTERTQVVNTKIIPTDREAQNNIQKHEVKIALKQLKMGNAAR